MAHDIQVPDESTAAVLRGVLSLLTLGEGYLFQLWQASNISLTQVRVLRAVAGGLSSAGAVARKVGLAPSSLSRTLDRLEQRALVRRHVDAQDRRRVLIEVTDEGQALLERVPSILGTEFRARVAGMNEAERAAFLSGVGALLRPGRHSVAGGAKEHVQAGPLVGRQERGASHVSDR